MYSAAKWFSPKVRPIAHESQPIAFLGRWEMMTAPAVERAGEVTVFSSQKSKMWAFAEDRLMVRSRRLPAVSAKERAHTDQAIQEAVRLLILLLSVLAAHHIKPIIAD
jgi:hypothetical protein